MKIISPLIFYTFIALTTSSIPRPGCDDILPKAKYCSALNTVADQYMEISVVAPHLTPKDTYDLLDNFKVIRAAIRVVEEAAKYGVKGAKYMVRNDYVLRRKVSEYQEIGSSFVQSLAKGEEGSLEQQADDTAYLGEWAGKLKNIAEGRIEDIECEE